MAFVAFEGIDGSGKTTVSNRVVERLRARGLVVHHAREKGELVSPVAARIRALARDARNLALDPMAELLLYAAREAQTLAEVVRPALQRGALVIADRSLASHQALAQYGRGLEGEVVRRVLDAAAGGLSPDLVVLVDADPHIARARRRFRDRDPRQPPSRKSAAGPSLAARVRDGLLAMARAAPERWLVVDNSDADLDEVTARVERAILALDGAAPREPEGAPRSVPAQGREAPRDLDWLERTLLGWIERRAEREPRVAACVLSGLPGPKAAALRASLAARAPAEAALGTRGLDDPAAWDLRRSLAERCPDAVARSLAGLAHVGVPAELRERLSSAAPGGVAASLAGVAGPEAQALRRRLAAAAPAEVLASLVGLDDEPAWELRETVWDAPELAGPLLLGLARVGGEQAWRLRRSLFHEAPLEALRSLLGLDELEAWHLRQQWGALAPRVVLLSCTGMDRAAAWALREALAPVAKEALDSVWGMDHPAAWDLRSRWLGAYPSTAVASLGPLAGEPRGRALVWDAVARWPGNVSLLRHALRVLSAVAPEREAA